MTHEISDRGPAARVLAADAGDGADTARLHRVRQAPPGRMTRHFCHTFVARLSTPAAVLVRFWCASGALLVRCRDETPLSRRREGASMPRRRVRGCVGAEKEASACIMCWRRKGHLSVHHVLAQKRKP